MPLVHIRYRPNSVRQNDFMELGTHLIDLVVKALHIPEVEAAHLTHREVEVWCDPHGWADIMRHDISIVVQANRFPHRLTRLAERKESILLGVRQFLDQHGYASIKASVWVQLVEAEYGEC